MNASTIKTITLSLSTTFIAFSLILFPKASFEASLRGLQMWWEVVFPSLLPFFIVSELLIGFGVVRFIGVLLEPIMRPLFRVPGSGGFVWAMGLASGFPAGAKFTARLRQEEELTAIEAERLVSFTNSSNPLFIFSAISVGFFANAQLGILLALSHYLGNICVGLLMRFHGKKEEKKKQNEKKKPILIEAFKSMHVTRLEDKRPFGKLLGDAVYSSISTLLMIGGFIILFSVLNSILSLINLTSILATGISILLAVFYLPDFLSVPLLSGLFEITLGSKLTSATENVSLLHKVIITSFILGFSGFSVQAQVASILAETDIRFKPFFVARIFHGLIAAFLAYVLYEPIYQNRLGKDLPVFAPFYENNQAESTAWQLWEHLTSIGPLFTLFGLCLFITMHMGRMKNERTN
ncbi:sporulation integral membrane protein YlbJ [Lottiidibacillus patelloidae]|uniref:Sporulation integral membrane protein YlbJ n=1 Tax=Lottiidibacillus patelloidae TaxID=2670334 RepID=A0A263BY20_9BACI|nr:sporulation integral membrane protein YlbJ [Lottiidibacillus patelloidae]OZM58488.1 sporulation integral membrane protein YlbJ [Lottiidibacillus patelloidae]